MTVEERRCSDEERIISSSGSGGRISVCSALRGDILAIRKIGAIEAAPGPGEGGIYETLFESREMRKDLAPAPAYGPETGMPAALGAKSA
jgi:hypothetical protein